MNEFRSMQYNRSLKGLSSEQVFNGVLGVIYARHNQQVFDLRINILKLYLYILYVVQSLLDPRMLDFNTFLLFIESRLDITAHNGIYNCSTGQCNFNGAI